VKVPTILNCHSLTLKGTVAGLALHIVHALNWSWYVWHWMDVFHLLLSPTVLFHKAHGGREDDFPPLPRLYGPGRKGLSGSHPFYMVYDGYLCVAGKHKVAMHRVHRELRVHGLLGGSQCLRDCRSAKDTARTRWMPQWACIREEIGVNVAQLRQFKDRLNLRLRLVDGRRADEGGHGGELRDYGEGESEC
jgi:hypothetical protein